MSIWLGTSFMGMNGFRQLYVNGGVARARGVFAGGFEKFRCFNVVFLWFVCGERLVKAGSLTVTFSWSEIFHFFNFILRIGVPSGLTLSRWLARHGTT